MSATITLHPALTAAQAEHRMRELGATLKQDGRGNVRLTFQQCANCRSTVCAEMGLCARPQPPEAA